MDGQLSNKASTYHSAAPAGTGSVTVVVVTRAMLLCGLLSTPNQMRYALTPGTAFQRNVTGDVVVEPFGGDTSATVPPPHCGGATVNRLVCDFSELQLANFASTYQSIVPAGTIRVAVTSLVSAIWANAAPLTDVEISYETAFGTALHWNVMDGSVLTALAAGAINVAGMVPHPADPTVNRVNAERVLQLELKMLRMTPR